MPAGLAAREATDAAVKVVVALGGNAILPSGASGTAHEQLEAVSQAAEQLADLVRDGHELVVTHGNGPQVGALMVQQRRAELEIPPLPLDVLDAETQGQIGYLLVQQLGNALRRRDVQRSVAAVLTQVVVDPDDPAFAEPTKPVGPRYTETELAFRMERKTDSRSVGRPDDAVEPDPADTTFTVGTETYRRVEGGRWRRVVPSPLPIDVVEAEPIKALLAAGVVPVCGGGGGIPVSRADGTLTGVEAVIDKDRTAALLVRLLDADALVILTDVDAVQRDYGTPQAKALPELSVPEAREMLAAGAFPAGSMGPKVEAAVEVADHGGLAIITSLDKALDALAGRAGTRVSR